MFASVSIHTVAIEHQHLFKFFFRFLHLRHFNSLDNRYNQIKCHIRHQCYLLPNEMLFRVAARNSPNLLDANICELVREMNAIVGMRTCENRQ